jgi:membrane-associated phospholipid phosphatase
MMHIAYGRLSRFFAVIVILIAAESCGTLSNGRTWGQDAIYPLDLGSIPRAAYHALVDVQTLLPLAGAVAVAPFDRKVSDWATAHTPIYGSHNAAANADTTLQVPLEAEWILTALATPSGDDPKEWLYAKVKGIGVEWLSQRATGNATTFVKREAGRTRPDGSDTQSMPSSAATSAFNYSTLANRNLDDIPLLPTTIRIPLQVSNILLASGVGWARVEAQQHYPSDVLVGAALGHFLTSFICEAFMGLPEGQRFGFSFAPSKRGVMIGVTLPWY